MIKFIIRIIKLLLRVGIIKDVYKFIYNGKGFSLNDFYSQGHWSKRAKLKDKYSIIFKDIVKKGKIKWMDQFVLLILYRSLHDVDNVTGMEKVFTDNLKGEFIAEDSYKFFKGFAIFYDEDLPRNTWEFYLLPL